MITLKKITINDKLNLEKVVTNDIVKQTYMLPDFKDQEHIDRMCNHLIKVSNSDNHILLGIYLEEELIGFLNDVEVIDNEIEFGYVLHPNYHNKGYMTLAVKQYIQVLMQKGYKKIIAGAFEHNIASLRVMQKAGMKLIDKTDVINYRGKDHKCIYYCIE